MLGFMANTTKDKPEDLYARWFGARLREALGNMPQTDLVSLMQQNGFSVTPGRVSHYMQGRRYPDPQTLREMAKALGVSADWLLGLIDQTATPAAELEEELAQAKGEGKINKLMKKLSPDRQQEVIRFAEFLLSESKRNDDQAEYNIAGWEAAMNAYQRKHGVEAADDFLELIADNFPELARLVAPASAPKHKRVNKG